MAGTTAGTRATATATTTAVPAKAGAGEAGSAGETAVAAGEMAEAAEVTAEEEMEADPDRARLREPGILTGSIAPDHHQPVAPDDHDGWIPT